MMNRELATLMHRCGLREDRWNEAQPDRKNPLKVAPPQRLSDAFDRMDELDSAMIEMILGRESQTKEEYRDSIIAARNKLGQITSVPLTGIISTEPKLYGEHLDALVSGGKTQFAPSGKKPIVYLLGDGYWVVDGNHRLAAAALQGHDDYVVHLLDLRQLETELFS